MSIIVYAPAPVPVSLQPHRTLPPPRRQCPAGPTSRAAPAAEVRLPDAGGAPDWSAATLALLADLTVLERAVVEWRAAGYSAAESYRRASGNDSPSARQSAHQIARRPRVAAALASALNDRNLAARVDREWVLQRLYDLVEDCERAGTPRATRRLIDGLRLIAKLQGWLTSGRRPPPPAAEAIVASEPSRRLDDLIARAQAALFPAANRRPDAVDDAHRQGRRTGPRDGASGPPSEPAALSIPAAGGEQLASAAGRARPGPQSYLFVAHEPFMGVH